jgi:3'-phosphoadenosine 5'-phosphosulfate sulfotransferase (PAPS reductase)/FAD synthetase
MDAQSHIRPVATKPFLLPEGNVQISFSGGRTSAYMLHQILEANGDLPERCKVIFANTGREMPETLDFVQECSLRWSVPIIWLEYKKDKNGVGFNVVNHNSASRNGEPFENMIFHRRMLPNLFQRFCTSELKVLTIRRYLVSCGWKKWNTAVGIRADEAHRAKENNDSKMTVYYPLNKTMIGISDVTEFWKKQKLDFDFDLNITKGFGNCDGCFLKSEQTIANLWRMYPDRAKWWAEQEAREFKGKDPKRHHLQRFKRDKASYAEIKDFISRQGDWVFEQEGLFCQADDGECTG